MPTHLGSLTESGFFDTTLHRWCFSILVSAVAEFCHQSLLGHSSLNMTRIYAEQVDSEDAVRAYKAVVR